MLIPDFELHFLTIDVPDFSTMSTKSEVVGAQFECESTAANLKILFNLRIAVCNGQFLIHDDMIIFYCADGVNYSFLSNSEKLQLLKKRVLKKGNKISFSTPYVLPADKDGFLVRRLPN